MSNLHKNQEEILISLFKKIEVIEKEVLFLSETLKKTLKIEKKKIKNKNAENLNKIGYFLVEHNFINEIKSIKDLADQVTSVTCPFCKEKTGAIVKGGSYDGRFKCSVCNIKYSNLTPFSLRNLIIKNNYEVPEILENNYQNRPETVSSLLISKGLIPEIENCDKFNNLIFKAEGVTCPFCKEKTATVYPSGFFLCKNKNFHIVHDRKFVSSNLQTRGILMFKKEEIQIVMKLLKNHNL